MLATKLYLANHLTNIFPLDAEIRKFGDNEKLITKQKNLCSTQCFTLGFIYKFQLFCMIWCDVSVSCLLTSTVRSSKITCNVAF